MGVKFLNIFSNGEFSFLNDSFSWLKEESLLIRAKDLLNPIKPLAEFSKNSSLSFFVFFNLNFFNSFVDCGGEIISLSFITVKLLMLLE